MPRKIRSRCLGDGACKGEARSPIVESECAKASTNKKRHRKIMLQIKHHEFYESAEKRKCPKSFPRDRASDRPSIGARMERPTATRMRQAPLGARPFDP